jgi:hypothetical protein
MSMRSVVRLGLVTLPLALIAGCPGPTDGDPPTPVALAGTWSGTLTCTSTEYLGDLTGTPRPGTRDVVISFDDDGLPTALVVWGFNNAADRTTDKREESESEAFEYTSGDLEITLVVTVAEMTYTETSVRVVLDLEYSAAGGALIQEGTGTMTIEITLDGEELNYHAIAEYEIMQTATGLDVTFETGETIECEGTLTREQ